MNGKLGPALSFFIHWLHKEDHYSQQSPFVFSIYSGLIDYLKSASLLNSDIEKFRELLLSSTESVYVTDLGAGSKKVNQHKREIRKVTKYSTSTPKFCTIYQYFCQLTPAAHVIELGTCLGISTRYLSKVTKGNLWTIEGAEELWRVSQQDPKPTNTEFVLGDISQVLPKILEDLPKVDFALIDGNHTLNGTLDSFELLLSKCHLKSILVIGDIHWSNEMEQAWQTIKNHPKILLTMDFYECGIVFLDYSGEKKHLILDI